LRLDHRKHFGNQFEEAFLGNFVLNLYLLIFLCELCGLDRIKFPFVKGLGQTNHAEDQSGNRVLHTLDPAFHKNFLKLKQQFKVRITVVGVPNEADETCYLLLALFKLIGLFFTALVIL